MTKAKSRNRKVTAAASTAAPKSCDCACATPCVPLAEGETRSTIELSHCDGTLIVSVSYQPRPPVDWTITEDQYYAEMALHAIHELVMEDGAVARTAPVTAS